MLRILRPMAVLTLLVALVFAGCGESEPTGSDAGDATAAGSDSTVNVYPSPGTSVASTQSQISIVGISPDEIGDVTVEGSKSGEISGTFEEYDAVEGASFIPDRNFSPGETVTVTTGLDVTGAEDGTYSFRTGRFKTQAEPPPKDLPPEGDIPPEPETFKSRPDLRPPKVNVETEAGEEVAPGYIFIAPKLNGPMIVDNQGELVYYKPGIPTADFRPQEYDGETYLTWWQGPFNAGGYTQGRYLMFDENYEQAKEVYAGNGYLGDLHEYEITDRGTVFVPAYRAVLMDLSDMGGPENAAVLDSIAQEIDIETGLVVWEWHSIGNVGLDESYSDVPQTPEEAFDYFHINSIKEDFDGNLVISARNTSSVFKVDRGTGEVIWRIGGKKPTFEQGKGLRMGYQHDAIPLEEGVYSIYDNGAAPQVNKQSRGLVVEVDEDAGTAKLARPPYTHPTGILASSQGNMQTLDNGNVLIGWGSEPWVTEFNEAGDVLFDANYAARNSSYRSYRSEWEGDPSEDPAIATQAGNGKVNAWVSWNGATEVATWELLGGESESELEPIAEAERDGFETRLTAQGDHTYLAARALDADGNELGESEVVQAGESWRPEVVREE